MLAATLQRQAREQALQAQAIRTAVWGEPEAFGEFLGRLTGQVTERDVTEERDAALAAFGLRVEQSRDG